MIKDNTHINDLKQHHVRWLQKQLGNGYSRYLSNKDLQDIKIIHNDFLNIEFKGLIFDDFCKIINTTDFKETLYYCYINPDGPSRSYKVPDVIDWDNLDCPISKYFTINDVVSGLESSLPYLTTDIKSNILWMSKQLDNIINDTNIMIDVISWFRTPKQNHICFGGTNSPHCVGLACDIKASNSDNTWFIQSLLYRKWRGRAGLAANDYIHLDLYPYGCKSTPIGYDTNNNNSINLLNYLRYGIEAKTNT